MWTVSPSSLRRASRRSEIRIGNSAPIPEEAPRGGGSCPSQKEGPVAVELDAVVLLPHLGSASRGTHNKMASMAATSALAMPGGEPAPGTVNPDVFESAAYAKRVGT